jgi:hypothetical protein
MPRFLEAGPKLNSKSVSPKFGNESEKMVVKKLWKKERRNSVKFVGLKR